TLLLWARSRHRQSTRSHPYRSGHSGSAQREALAQSRSQLKTACLSGDPGGAAKALLAWSRARWPDAPPKGLTELSRRFATDAARRDTLALDRLLYDKGNDSWDGRAAWSVFKQAIEHAAQESDASSAPALPALYPQHGQLA
ncbi:MAG: BatD family protein, partial [Thiogranum sp.]